MPIRCPSSSDCCAPLHSPTKIVEQGVPLPKRLERVCVVALAVFAAYLNAPLFLISVGVGIAYQMLKRVCAIDQKGFGGQRPGCGQGFGELFAQIPLSSLEIVAATAYVLGRHLGHDPQGFVPFVGFFMGMGAVHHLEAVKNKIFPNNPSKTV